MPFLPDLGNSDFKALRRGGRSFVDKSGFIVDVVEDPASILLFPRPRRFGKSINLSMLRYFFEAGEDERDDLFEDLKVWSSEAARAHYKKHPVIWLSFKDAKHASLEEMYSFIKMEVRELYKRNRWLIDESRLSREDEEDFKEILNLKADLLGYQLSLNRLSGYLSRASNQKVVILIDEYDSPIHSAYLHGYYEKMVDFMRVFLSGGLKDNPNVYRGVLTGILRVAREGLFSGLNNIKVYSMLRARHGKSFGFVESEVEAICKSVGVGERMEEVRAMYNGYIVGALSGKGEAIYNPWSVLNFVAGEEHVIEPYWVNTASEDLIRELALKKGFGLNAGMGKLLRGEEVEVVLDENIVLRDREFTSEALWTFLWFSGYLKTTEAKVVDAEIVAKLKIPNREVRGAYKRLFRHWMEQGLRSRGRIERMIAALLEGKEKEFERDLSELMRKNLSYYDGGGPQPEKLYHGFILGLLVHLEGRYQVVSNLESGYGRADVLLIPKQRDEPGVVMELKVLGEDESVEEALEGALKQIQERRYETRVEAVNPSEVYVYGVVFDGKRAYAALA